jgi:AsmA protein
MSGPGEEPTGSAVAPGNKGSRRWLGVLVALLLVLVLVPILAALLLPRFVDTGEIRNQLVEQVRSRTGREIRIEGDLDLSLLPGLAVEASEVVLVSAGDGEPGGRIGRARLRVALLPLLRREISVQGLRLEDLDLELQNEAAGSHFQGEGLSLETGPLLLGQEGPTEPVDLTLRGNLRDLEAGLGGEVSLTTRAILDLGRQVHRLEDVRFELIPEKGSGDAAGPTLPPLTVTAPALVVDLGEESLAVDRFDLESAGMRLRGQLEGLAIVSRPELRGMLTSEDFAPRPWLTAVGIELPATGDPEALGRARFQGRFAVSEQDAVLEDLSFQLDDSTLAGLVAARGLDREQPALRFELTLDAIDLDRYVPPEEPAAGGPATDPGGDGGAAGTPVLPIFAFGDRDVEGRLLIGRLQTAGLALTDVTIGLAARNGQTRIQPFTAALLGGRYEGDLRIDERGDQPVIRFDEKLESVAFAELAGALVDFGELSGTASGRLQGTGTGRSLDAVLETLDGALSLRLDEGALEGIDLWYELRSAVALVRGEPGPEVNQGRTVFTRLAMDADIAGGVMGTDNLTARLPFLTLDGAGVVDLRQLGLDFDLLAEVLETPEVSEDPLGAELAGISVPLKLTGPVTEPEVAVDLENLLRGEVTRRLLDKLLD